MANSLTIQSKLQAVFGAETYTNTQASATAVPESTSEQGAHLSQEVGTGREAVILGDVDITNATGNDYWLQLRNTDDTNIVTVEMKYGASNYLVIGQMRPGASWGPVNLPKLDASGYNGIYLTAAVAACLVVGAAAEAGDPAA